MFQDAIVNLNLSKEDEEPNLAILPALREVEKLSLLSHSIKNYILCLDVAHSDYLIDWIVQETSNWVKQLFRFYMTSFYCYDHNLSSSVIYIYIFMCVLHFLDVNMEVCFIVRIIWTVAQSFYVYC